MQQIQNNTTTTTTTTTTTNCQKLSNTLTCCKDNAIALFCSSQQCKQYAGLCSKQDCDCKTKIHNSCLELTNSKSMFEIILAKRKKMSEQVDLVIQKIQKIYDQMLDKLSLQKQALLKFKQNYGLNRQEINLFENIQFNMRQNITGKDIYQIKSNIKKITVLTLSEKEVNKIWKQQREKIDDSLKNLNYFFNDPQKYNLKPKFHKSEKLIQKLNSISQNSLKLAFDYWKKRTLEQ